MLNHCQSFKSCRKHFGIRLIFGWLVAMTVFHTTTCVTAESPNRDHVLDILNTQGQVQPASSHLCIYPILNSNYFGERHQILAVVEQLKVLKSNDVHVLPINYDTQSQFEQDFSTDPHLPGKGDLQALCRQHVMIAVGVTGLQALKFVSHENPDIFQVHMSHQMLKEEKELVGTTNLIVLPEYEEGVNALEKSIPTSSKTRILKIPRVVQSFQKDELVQAYENQKQIFPESPEYLGVILAGDAEKEQGEITYFTKKDVEKLAHYVTSYVLQNPGTHLLVTNGPRTGKYDFKTGQVMKQRHRNGTSDPITQEFDHILSQTLHKSQYSIYDFQYNQPSIYKAFLGLLIAKQQPLFLDGQKSSAVLVAEAILLLKRSTQETRL